MLKSLASLPPAGPCNEALTESAACSLEMWNPVDQGVSRSGLRSQAAGGQSSNFGLIWDLGKEVVKGFLKSFTCIFIIFWMFIYFEGLYLKKKPLILAFLIIFQFITAA